MLFFCSKRLRGTSLTESNDNAAKVSSNQKPMSKPASQQEKLAPSSLQPETNQHNSSASTQQLAARNKPAIPAASDPSSNKSSSK